VIEIASYSPLWAREFELEAAVLRNTLVEFALRVEHVGSTAVPGLAAKPVIDIQISVKSLAPFEIFEEALARLGYRFVSLGEFDRVYPWFAKPGGWPSTHHVHLCVSGEEQEARHLAFRDCLRSNPDQALRYEALKRKLATEHRGKSLASIESYSLAKTEFIESALASAGLACRGRSDA
jgi:GrpB-like predicted nucleotidyltransferase (UPF0157 family)